jgi:hypothetical protein
LPQEMEHGQQHRPEQQTRAPLFRVPLSPRENIQEPVFPPTLRAALFPLELEQAQQQQPLEHDQVEQWVDAPVQQRLQQRIVTAPAPGPSPEPDPGKPARVQSSGRRGRPRKAPELGPIVRCSSCGHTNKTRPELDFVQCSMCKKMFHRACVATWLDNGAFCCKSCKPRRRSSK